MLWWLLACAPDAPPAAKATDDEPSSPAPAPSTSNPPTTPPVTPEGTVAPYSVAAAVDRARFEADLVALAVPRSPGTPGWQAAQERCADRLTELGFEVSRHEYGSGTNVLGRLPGSSNDRGAVVVAAHYDSVAECPGADDNASGVAAALEVARVLSAHAWRNDLWVACLDEEELGLKGSDAWAAEAKASGARIQLAWSFETMAYASAEPGSQSLPFGFGALFPDVAKAVAANDDRGDFIAFIADEAGSGPALAAFEDQARADALPVMSMLLADEELMSPLTGDLRRSDHASFWARGYPAVMLTDTADYRNDAYHCLRGQQDTVDRLDVDFAVKVVRSAAASSAALLSSAPR